MTSEDLILVMKSLRTHYSGVHTAKIVRLLLSSGASFVELEKEETENVSVKVSSKCRNQIEEKIKECITGILEINKLVEIDTNIDKALTELKEATLTTVNLTELEKKTIKDALLFTKGNRKEASILLGIGERTMYRKIKEYGFQEFLTVIDNE